MKIGSVDAKVSVLAIVVVVIFAFFLVFYYLTVGDLQVMIWGVPTLVLLFLIPLGLNYMSQKQYLEMTPV